MQEILSPAALPDPRRLNTLHKIPALFQKGKPVEIAASLNGVPNPPALEKLVLRYRRVNQAEIWQSLEMSRTPADCKPPCPPPTPIHPTPCSILFCAVARQRPGGKLSRLPIRLAGQPLLQ